LGEQAAAAQGLEGKAKADLVNSYQQAFATLGGAVGGIAAGGAGGGNAVVAGVHGAGSGYAVDAFNRQLHPDERKWAQENARKYQQYLASKTGEAVTTEEAYQRLLSAGYAVVDDAAARGGKSDEIAKQYINANAPKSMFAATASERANPFLNGNADGSFTPEQQARFGSSKPGQQASAAVTRAMPYVGQPCSDCRSKVAALDDAVTKLQEARLLYQDDAGSVKLIDQQIDQLKAAITKDELARGMAGAISDKDKGIAALVLGTPSRVLAGAATSELLERTALTQAIKEVRAGLASDVKKGGNVAVAQIDIPGLPSQMAASSKVDNAGRGVVGDGSGNFAATELPLKNGDLVKRNTDSEYKILDNIADLLGDNTELRGRVKIVTERPACDSCLNVVEQFRAKYPNIEVKVFDNNGVPLPPRNTPTGGG
jgi:filamentous hemagglutinin